MEPAWSPEDEEKAKQLAQKVVDRRMALPAILFLESVRPLHFIGGQFLHFMAPISGLVVGKWDLDRVGDFLEHRGAVPFVIEEIQRRDKVRSDEEQARKRASKEQAAAPGAPSTSAPRKLPDESVQAPSDSRHT